MILMSTYQYIDTYWIHYGCMAFPPYVRALTQEPFDLKCGMQVTIVKAKNGIDFQPPRSNHKVKGQFNVFSILYGVIFMRVIHSSNSIKYLLTSRSYPKVRAQPHMTPKLPWMTPIWPQMISQMTPILHYCVLSSKSHWYFLITLQCFGLIIFAITLYVLLLLILTRRQTLFSFLLSGMYHFFIFYFNIRIYRQFAVSRLYFISG